MTGLQMQILMSIRVHSQKKKSGMLFCFVLFFFLFFPCFFFFVFFLNRLFRHKNKTAFPVSDRIIKNINIVSVCFSLTSCEICEENGTETWIFSLTF